MRPGASSGALEGRRHLLDLRVHYSQTDAGGVVYHAQYLIFADHARTEFLRLIGWPFDRLQRDHGLIWLVRHASLDLQRPAKLDDAIVVETTLLALYGASIGARQIIKRDNDTLADVRLRLALVNADGRPARMPRVLMADLRQFLDDSIPYSPPFEAS